MMLNIFHIFHFLKYSLFSGHKHGHGIHSPFVYELLTEVIEEEKLFYSYEEISLLREELEKNDNIIFVNDYGTGKSKNQKISDIAKKSSIQTKHGELIFRLVNHFQPKTIVELGSSLGISTLYLGKPNSQATVYTIEGCPEKANLARKNFKNLKVNNIELITGKFEDVIPTLISPLKQIDFVYIDGNHKKKPTLAYFDLLVKKVDNDSVIIIHDIYCSKEMHEAWQIITKHPKVTATIDIFYMGIIFFRQEMQQQNFIIRF
jgi:predicted O-methyltransferase YrrM